VVSGWNGEVPDAIGFKTEFGYRGSIVVEVKTSRADFFADAKKPHRNGSIEGMGNWRYYLCPSDLIKPEEIPGKYGLLYVNNRGHVKHIISPFNTDHWSDYAAEMERMRFNADNHREMFVLIKLLARLGDVDKYNTALKNS